MLQCKLIAKNESGLVFKGGDAFNSCSIKYYSSKEWGINEVLLELNYEFKDKDEVIEIVGKSVHAQVQRLE